MDESKIKIIFSDEIEFFLSAQIIDKIPKIKKILEEEKQEVIIFNNFDAKLFSYILSCVKYKLVSPNENDFIDDLVKNMDFEILANLLIAANFLELKFLEETISSLLLNIINNEPVEGIRNKFKLTDDLTESDMKIIEEFYRWEN